MSAPVSCCHQPLIITMVFPLTTAAERKWLSVDIHMLKNSWPSYSFFFFFFNHCYNDRMRIIHISGNCCNF